MIVVTRLDGRKMALNVDRVERVERNETTLDTNLYFIGGARLTVIDHVDDLVERIVDAKSRVVARAFMLANDTPTPSLASATEDEDRRGSLRVVPSGAPGGDPT